MVTRMLSFLILASLWGCATGGSPAVLSPDAPGYVAPTASTVVTGVQPTSRSAEIYVQNNSSAVVVVTSVTIINCVNVTPCGFLPLKDRVEPNQRREIAMLRPLSSDEAYTYKYTWTWSAAPSR